LKFHRLLLDKIRVELDLVDYWLDFGEGQQVNEGGDLAVANSDALYQAQFHTTLNLFPDFVKGNLWYFRFSILPLDLRDSPVEDVEVEVFELERL
jgi:hypothetical protein